MGATSSPRPNATNPANSHLSPRSSGPRHLQVSNTRTAHAARPNGSLTQTITPEDTASSRSVSPDPLVLRLRGAHDTPASNTSTSRRRGIRWAEDVIDNEGLGRKSSKVCCIYHKAREFGESSSEDDSSSDGDSSADGGGGSDSPDDGGARLSGNRRGSKSGGRGHGHKHGDECDHDHGKGKRKPSPNAYEKIPRYKPKTESKQK
jgi:protein phosphatase 1 regulatory subunit 11